MKTQKSKNERERFKTIFLPLQKMNTALKWKNFLKMATCSVTQVQKKVNHVHGFAIQVTLLLVPIMLSALVIVH